MPIAFSCPCGRALRVKDELAGRRVKCPACGEALTVPSVQAAAEGEPAPQTDLWGGATPRGDEPRAESENVEELSEVLPADSDEEDEEIDEDDLSTRERVRRREARAKERAAEREAKDRKKRRNKKVFRELAERGRRRIYGSGRRRSGGPILYNINAGIGGGIVMIVLSVLCSGLAFKARGIICVTPILFVVGIAALIKGIIDSKNS
ncbi:MAG TPA: hypothetical protein VFW33_21280 [Gemmataceae bacterium]|nr:hypothetical protein [Gemmataceae bacterium]